MKPPLRPELSEILLLRLAAPQWCAALGGTLRKLAPGGVLLSPPLPSSPDTLHDLLSQITQLLPTPPILAIEEDGRAKGPLSVVLPPLPGIRILGEKGPRQVRQAADLVGEALRLWGFNTDLAPSLDVAPALHPEAGGSYTLDVDPRAVTECGHAFIEGLSRYGIMACGKCFPGDPGAKPEAGGNLGVSSKTMVDLWRHDLIPYRQLSSQLPFIRMSTTGYKAYNFEEPCSAVFSRQVVQGLLRSKLEFPGVVIAPGLESQSVRGELELGPAAAQSIDAGCDMLLVERPESWLLMRQGIERALESGQLDGERVEQALARIYALKKGVKPLPRRFSNAAWDRLARRFEEFGLP